VAVHVYPSLVQGVDAPSALVAALASAQQDDQAEAVLLCRGGGSLEDLWAFNDERVVRAVAACRLPLVCGVGHETDVTLADLAADVRAATPTAAAELAAPARSELGDELTQLAARMQRRVGQRLDGAAQRLDNLTLRLQRPGQLLASQSVRLTTLTHRHEAALRRSLDQLWQRHQQLGEQWVRAGRLLLERQQAHCQRQAQRLEPQDPRRVLQRGYAWIAQPDGQPVVSARALVTGQSLRAVWSDGQATVVVDEVEPGAGT
jgi:exodeoxyribonuclease VII large subunit